MQSKATTVVVLGTGGTIAGASAVAGDDLHYVAGQIRVESLVAAVPGLLLPLECEQLAQVDSKDMTHALWLCLAARVAHHLARVEVAGVVITHGTDTLEETAYFLSRTVLARKPVVLTAAMRPATSHEADGPANLRDAVIVARCPEACGVLAVLAGQVHGAAHVHKVHPTRLDAFGSGEAGPVAQLAHGAVVALRDWPVSQRAPVALLSDAHAWPCVAIVASHAGATGREVDALVRSGVRGLVVECTGNASVHEQLEAALLHAQSQGVGVLRTSRCREGPVQPREGEVLAVAPGLTAAKARVELMLGLMAEQGGD